MKRHIFLSTVAAVCLLAPAAAFADPPTDHGQGQGERKDQPHQQGPGAGKANPAAAAQRGGGPRAPSGPEAGSRGGPGQQGGDRNRQPQAQTAPPVPQRTQQAQRPARQPAAPTVQRAAPPAADLQRQPGGRAGQQQYSGQQQHQAPLAARPAPLAARPAAMPSLGQWRAPAGRPERRQAGQQWRQQHQNWDQNATWRRNTSWWRNDNSFRLFTGLRIGFFFVPDRGYIPLPAQYRDRRWQAGDYLPSWFRAYTVNDYARYGLPPPPYGCVWVWLNGDVALIDPSDGYILDIAQNVW